MKIYSNVKELIGNTPLVRMDHFAHGYDFEGRLYGKLDYTNPGGTNEARAIINMVQAAKANGTLFGHGILVQISDGTSGIGLGIAGAMLGYRAHVVMLDNVPVERQKMVRAYGARVILVPAEEGMEGAKRKAEEISQRHDGSIILDPYTDPANVEAHYNTTGPELWEDADGDISIFVCPVNTGGTITGVARYLKEKNPDIKIVAVEPKRSAVLSGGKPGPHKIPGIGCGFIPEILDMDLIDEVLAVTDDEAKLFMREGAKSESMVVGPAAGAALCAAAKLCGRETALRAGNDEKSIVVYLPDAGERFMSMRD